MQPDTINKIAETLECDPSELRRHASGGSASVDQQIISQLLAGRSDDLIRVLIGLIEDTRNETRADLAALSARLDEMERPATPALRPHLNSPRAHTKK